MLDKTITHLLFLVSICCISQASFALEFLDDQRNIDYSQLNYEASKLFLSFDTDITLSKKATTAIVNDLVLPKDGNALTPEPGSVYIVTTDSKFFGKHTKYTMWFDESAALLQWLREIRSSKSNVKLYRFASNGYYDYRKDYDNEDYVVNLTDVKNWGSSFKTYVTKVPEGQAVSDSSAILYLVSMLKLQNAGDEAQMVLNSDEQLANIRLVVEGKTMLNTNFDIVSSGNNQHIEEQRQAIKIKFVALDSQGNPAKDLQLLGLQGDIALYIDEVSRLLLQISGDVKIAGRVDIKLKRAVRTE
ncbi:hypothetical protein [Kaarinaea lacus]